MRKQSLSTLLKSTRLGRALPLILTVTTATACGGSDKAPEARRENDRSSESNPLANGQNGAQDFGGDGFGGDGFGGDGFGGDGFSDDGFDDDDSGKDGSDDDGSDDDGSDDDGSDDMIASEDPDSAGDEATCAVLPLRTARYSRTTTLEACGRFVITITPGEGGHSYTLASARQDASNPRRSTDSVILLQGSLIPLECAIAPELGRARFEGSGVGPSPYLETSFTAELVRLPSIAPWLEVSVQTHLVSGAIDCEEQLALEPL